MMGLLFAGGLAGLYFGGDWLVRGAAALAARFRVPPLVIGLTIVGFGTSTPELLVSVDAALRGAPGIAIGNVVGSNIANILLILGLSAVVGPLAAPFAGLRRDLGWMIAAAILCLPLFWNGAVGRVEGAVLATGIALYLVQGFRQVGTGAAPEPAIMAPWRALFLIGAGLVALMLGARALVDSASAAARLVGISEAVIGLTVVAVGTSLPELATSVTAALRGRRDIALGNVIGSNVFNVFAILGATALIAPIPVEARFLSVDVPTMIAVSLGLTALLWWRGGLGRGAGAALLLLYAAYIGAMAAI
ncbi:MAG: calcium/sodium antiporter [Gemmobacter sp.]